MTTTLYVVEHFSPDGGVERHVFDNYMDALARDHFRASNERMVIWKTLAKPTRIYPARSGDRPEKARRERAGPYEITVRVPMGEEAHRLVDAIVALPEADRRAATLALRAMDVLPSLGRFGLQAKDPAVVGERQPGA